MSQGMRQEFGCLNLLVSHFFIEKKLFFSVLPFFKVKFFKKTSERCYLKVVPIILNKDNSDSVKVFSGFVITLRNNNAGLKINCSHTKLAPG